MKAVVQRVTFSNVKVDGETIGEIEIADDTVLNHDIVYIIEIERVSNITQKIENEYLNIVFILERSLHRDHLRKQKISEIREIGATKRQAPSYA